MLLKKPNDFLQFTKKTRNNPFHFYIKIMEIIAIILVSDEQFSTMRFNIVRFLLSKEKKEIMIIKNIYSRLKSLYRMIASNLHSTYTSPIFFCVVLVFSVLFSRRTGSEEYIITTFSFVT